MDLRKNQGSFTRAGERKQATRTAGGNDRKEKGPRAVRLGLRGVMQPQILADASEAVIFLFGTFSLDGSQRKSTTEAKHANTYAKNPETGHYNAWKTFLSNFSHCSTWNKEQKKHIIVPRGTIFPEIIYIYL